MYENSELPEVVPAEIDTKRCAHKVMLAKLHKKVLSSMVYYTNNPKFKITVDYNPTGETQKVRYFGRVISNFN